MDLLIGNDLFSFNDIIALTSQRFCQLVRLSFMIKKNIADFPVLLRNISYSFLTMKCARVPVPKTKEDPV